MLLFLCTLTFFILLEMCSNTLKKKKKERGVGGGRGAESRQLYQETYSLDVMTKLAKAGTWEEKEEALFNLRSMLQRFSCVPE